MKHYMVFISSWIILALCAPAAAQDFKQGIHGMRWASSISQYDHLTEVRVSNPVAYYVNSNMIYRVANQPVPGVVYGFYQDQFFAVYIKLRTPDQFHHMKKRFSARYGTPKVTPNAANQQTIYRWKDADVTIKVKMKESIGEIKLAIYFAPLAAKINQEQLEQIPHDVFKQTPATEDKALKSAPLLNY